MKPFIHDDFILQTETARELYHNYAEKMPIYDYHCHLSPQQIAENKKFKNITELWLGGDHYKWRALRANGVDEKYITGDADDKEKFLKWAETVPNTIGNALYHWTHLELKRYFGIEELLNKDTAEDIWNRCNELLVQEDFSCQNLIKRSNVKVICTTDDPVDDLRFHEEIKNQADFDVKVLPTFRPDKGLEINREPFVGFVNQLEQVTNKKFASFKDYLSALEERVQFFHEVGCRVSDHGLGEVPYAAYEDSELDAIFQAGRNGDTVSIEDEMKFKTAIMVFLARCYKERGWAMQLHFGAIRNNNTKMFEKLGPDAGFDSIGDIGQVATPLNALLNAMEVNDNLPRTIVYNLNPAINELIGTTIQNFQAGSGMKGKIQFGSGWWFNDTKPGMLRQMTALMDQGLIMHFVGMLTDSRSFISYCRHEYFRRILCDLVGKLVEDGEIPNDKQLLQTLIEGVCFNNAKEYFSIEL